jgi:hypothetical protein
MSNVEVVLTLTFDIFLWYFSIENWLFNISRQGTGSYPCPPQGWQRLNRLTVNHNPLNTPCFFNASIAYWEQVGVNRHLGPSIGEMIH